MASHARRESLRERRARQKKNRIILYCCVTLAIAGAVGIYLFGGKKPEITMNGGNEVTIECGDEYTDPGASALVGKEDVSRDITTSGHVNTRVPGDYSVKYTVTSGKKSAEAERIIHVVDTTPPEIALLGDEEVTLYTGTEYDDPGAEATDIADGDISDRIRISGEIDKDTEGEYTLTYTVSDSSGNSASTERLVKVVKKQSSSSSGGTYVGKTSKGYTIKNNYGLTYIDGILVVNKTYSLPASYGPGDLTQEFYSHYSDLKAAGAARGYSYRIVSGYRSYDYQSGLYQRYANRDGYAAADRYSARAGHSEHQTGLAADINSLEQSWGDTAEGRWLNDNCYKYGFIIRFVKGKENETGYMYEPWHIRYVGVDLATKLYNNGDWITLEDYFGITSRYAE